MLIGHCKRSRSIYTFAIMEVDSAVATEAVNAPEDEAPALEQEPPAPEPPKEQPKEQPAEKRQRKSVTAFQPAYTESTVFVVKPVRGEPSGRTDAAAWFAA